MIFATSYGNKNFFRIEMTEILSCQRVLSATVFFGFMIHHMLRVNISIAIVEMVSKNDSDNRSPRFDWSEGEKNDVLGYFFWGYVLTQIPGGRLSELFGTKIVVGIGLLSASLLTIFTPFAASLNYYCLLFIRFLLGVSMGVHFASASPLATKWISPCETSKFMSHLVASSLGIAVTLPVCGYLIDYFGWPSVFYVTGGIGLVWSLCWWYLIYDSPEQHPRISKEEKEKLINEIRVRTVERTKTPWAKILTSAPVWAIITVNTCQSYVFFVAMTQLPTYMSEVLHFSIKENGWLSSLPYLMRYLSSLGTALAADYLIKKGKLSTVATRKTFTCSFFLGAAIAFSIQAFWGYSRIVSVIVFTGIFFLMGFSTPGFFGNSIDIAPRFAGTITGISQVPASLAGYLSTKIVALFTENDIGFEQWIYIFWTLVGVSLFAAIVFFICAAGEEQNWSVKKTEREMETLNITTK